jgi:GMP synthase-like glutamine amidotransferase
VGAARGAGVPFVGICFGHQLIAHALGGRVTRAEGGWGVGTQRASVASTTPWMVPPRDEYALLYSHQDQVVVLPEDGRSLASTNHAPVAMLAVGDTMLGIQGHPEFGASYLDALMADRVERIGAARHAHAVASLDEPRDEALVAQWIARFLGVS